jgi:hypothetical protein
MIEYPKLVGREFRPFDWYGWLMSLIGCVIMFLLIQDTTMTWPMKIIFFGCNIVIFLDYVWRVAYGRIYKHVYYDTIIHNMYEVEILDTSYYICADDEEELKTYIDLHYPLVGENYKIINQAEVESFIKKELFQ